MTHSGSMALLSTTRNTSTSEVTVFLENIAYTCAGASLKTPCVPGQEDGSRPKLFTCNYIGNASTLTVGPMVRHSSAHCMPSSGYVEI